LPLFALHRGAFLFLARLLHYFFYKQGKRRFGDKAAKNFRLERSNEKWIS